VESSAFFTSESDDVWGGTGTRSVLNTGLIDAIARAPIDLADDLDVAQALSRLVHDELRGYGTDSTNVLGDIQIAGAIRALRSVLRRLGIDFAPPFRDFTTFHDYWSREEMSGAGGWAAQHHACAALPGPIIPRVNRGRSRHCSFGRRTAPISPAPLSALRNASGHDTFNTTDP
jgi:hypothetical protein